VGSFLDDIWGGATDIVEGSVNIVTDLVGGVGGELLDGDISGAAGELFGTIQDDLIGGVLQGAIGPEGIGGGLIGALPEWVRGPGRSIITPTLEAWDWTMQELVDRPLGTLASVASFAGQDGIQHFFNTDTWRRAYEINDARTFGQSFAAALWQVNPFDDEEYNAVSSSAMFNLVSGFADFAQEFLDPIGVATGGVIGAARGSLVIARTGDLVDAAGGVRSLGRNSSRLLTPTRVIGGGTGFRPMPGRMLGENSLLTKSPEQLRRARQIQQTFTTSRVDSFMQSGAYARVGSQLDEASDMGSRLAVLNADKVMSQMPDQAKQILAHAPSARARDISMRTIGGDFSVFQEVNAAAEQLSLMRNNRELMERVDEFDRLQTRLDELADGGPDLAGLVPESSGTRNLLSAASLADEIVSWRTGNMPGVRDMFDKGSSWLGDEIRARGTLNKETLYRGFASEEVQELGTPHALASWTSDRAVAEHFSGASYELLPERVGPIIEAPPGTVYGVWADDVVNMGEDFAAQREFIGVSRHQLDEAVSGPAEIDRMTVRMNELAGDRAMFREVDEAVDWEYLLEAQEDIASAAPVNTVAAGGVFAPAPIAEHTRLSSSALRDAALERIISRGADGGLRHWASAGPAVPVGGASVIDRYRQMQFNRLDNAPSRDMIVDEIRVPRMLQRAGETRDRVVRTFTERLPHSIINFSDEASATQQFERMLNQASRVEVGGVRLIDEAGVARRLAEFGDARLGQRWAEVPEIYNRTVRQLTEQFDRLTADAGLDASFAGLQTQFDEIAGMWQDRVRETVQSVRDQPRRILDDGTVVEEVQHFTIPVSDTDGVIQQVNFRGTPSQLSTTAPIPRWDNVARELRKHERRAGGSVGQAARDVAGVPIGVANSIGSATMSVWRPAVLLTPKWPMRVGLDEQLRMMSDLGVFQVIGNWNTAIADLRHKYGIKYLGEQGQSEVLQRLMARVDETIGDAADGMELSAKFDAIGGADGLNAITRELTREQLANPTRRMHQAARAGLPATVATMMIGGPVAPAVVFGASVFARRSKIYAGMQRNAAMNFAGALQETAQQMLRRGLDDPRLAEDAAQMLRRGDSIAAIARREADTAALSEGVLTALDQSDQLLDSAGYGRMLVPGTNVSVRNAMGDHPRHSEAIARDLSSSGAMNNLVMGTHGAAQRSLESFRHPNWRNYDLLDETISSKDAAKYFRRTFEQVTSGSEWMRSSFYDVLWSDEPFQMRVDRLAANLAADDGLRLAVVGRSLIGPDDLTDVARLIVENADDILPQLDSFSRLRQTARDGGTVTWQDFKRAASRMAGDDETWRDVVARIREGNPELGIEAHPGFGRALSPDAEDMMSGRLGERWQGVSDRMESVFETLGTMPTDSLARSPYFRAKYDSEMMRRVSLMTDPDGAVNVSRQVLDEMESSSRAYALRETRDLLYDLAEETRAGELTANLIPFYNAWHEVLTRWAGLTVQNPYFTGRMMRLYSAEWNAETLGITQVEHEGGGTYLTFRLNAPAWNEDGEAVQNVFDIMPDSVRDMLVPKVLRGEGNQTIRFSKEGLNTMLQASTPGFGPLITVPVREAILAQPSLEETFGFMFPFGHPEGGLVERTIKDSLPTWAKSVTDMLYDSPTTERLVQSMFRDYVVEMNEAGTPIDFSDPLEVNAAIEVANDRAGHYHRFRIGAGLFSPTSTTLQSPYDPLIREARKLQRELPAAEAEAAFLARFGEDLFALSARMTQVNDGVASTLSSEELYMQHQELVAAYPEIGGWVSNSVGTTDEKYVFSQAAYRRQTEMQISATDERSRRERKSPLETVEDTEASLGWRKYNEVQNEILSIQAEREAAGLPFSLQSNAMQDIAAYKAQFVRDLSIEHPAWRRQYDDFSAGTERMKQTIRGFMVGVQDAALMSRPSTRHVIDYLRVRVQVQRELERRRDELGMSDNIAAGENSDLQEWWDIRKYEMGGRPEFSEIFNRYFERDTLAPSTFVTWDVPPILGVT